MEPDQKYAAVGLFVLLGAVGLVVLAMWLSGGMESRDKVCYVMRFDNSVAGLNVGSTITFRGVGVGQVEAIRINPRDDTQILVRAMLERSTPVKPNTIARLKPQGVTGASYIELDLQDGVRDSGQETRAEGCKLIVTVPSGIDQIVNRLPQILDKTLEVTDRLANLLGSGNMTNVSETLANLNALTLELRETGQKIGPKIDSASGKLDEAMSHLSDLTASLEDNGNTAQDMRETVQQAKATMAEVKALASDIRANPSKLLVAPKVNEVEVR